MIAWLGITTSKFHAWRQRYGKENTHNAATARGWWLEEWEQKAIIDFQARFPLESHRCLAFMMLDADVVAVSPSSVGRVLRNAGRVQPAIKKASFKSKSFRHSRRPHERWDFEVSKIRVIRELFYFASVVDCCTRFILHWELHESMNETETQAIVRRACERYPDARPDLSANIEPTIIARDVQQFIDFRTTAAGDQLPDDRQRDGELPPEMPVKKLPGIESGESSPAAAFEPLLAEYVRHYNEIRPHRALGYITPADKLAGRELAIFAARTEKFELARQRRNAAWEAAFHPG